MAQRTTSEAFAGVFNEGMDRFVQQLVNAYQTEYQMKQQAQAQALEQQRYEQQRQDQMEREQRQQVREDAGFVKDLLLSQQDKLAQAMQNVTDPAMRARLGSQLDENNEVLSYGAAGPEALMQAHQQRQEAAARQPSQEVTMNPRQPDWVPTGEVPLAPQGIQVNVKPPMSPMALVGQAGQQAQAEERRRTQTEQLRTEDVAQRRHDEQVAVQMANSVVTTLLQNPDATPESRAQSAAALRPYADLLPEGTLQSLAALGAVVDERAQQRDIENTELLRLSRREAEQTVAKREWADPMDQQKSVLETGLGYETLGPEQRDALITSLEGRKLDNGNPIETHQDLRTYLNEQYERSARRVEVADEAGELANTATKVSIKSGNQQVERTANIIDYEEWQHERDKILSGYEDEDRSVLNEQHFVDSVGNAVAAGTPEVIDFYLSAYDNPNSVSGKRLRAMYSRDYLQRKAGEARHMQELQIERVETDNATRDIAYQEAKLNLNTQTQLAPYQRAAMRATYELEAGQAEQDLRDVLFNSEINKASALGQLAQVVPPEMWDNLSPEMRQYADDLGFPIDGLKTISVTQAALRSQPLRQEATNNFLLLTQSEPRTPEGKAAAIATARGYLNDMELPEELHGGYLSVLEAHWTDAADERDMEQLRYNLSLAQFEHMKSTDDARLNLERQRVEQAGKKSEGGGDFDINNQNTADLMRRRQITDKQKELEEYRQALQVSGCGLFYQSEGIVISLPEPENADAPFQGGTCADGLASYPERYEQLDNMVNRANAQTDQVLSHYGYEPISSELPPLDGGSGGGAGNVLDLDADQRAYQNRARELVSDTTKDTFTDDLTTDQLKEVVLMTDKLLEIPGITQDQVDVLIWGEPAGEAAQ